MILLDTNIWMRWANQAGELTSEELAILHKFKIEGLGISAISCWEVAMLHSKGRITLSMPIKVWMRNALDSAGVLLLPLTPEISIESTLLPGDFPGDPADRIIVATAINRGLKLVTRDSKIRAYQPMLLAI